ncbi:MTAP family purine nucleoside phosphorylase [Peptoniphilus stercorisuis]|uniref:5'-methylthioadenosine phosphorylase n=1 Tax=Peptoniphilus stercorisuis TaxID=1436965 RepID=A0ABS4KBR3_9FIRM|nr:MTAP family purine nucleoside phosphorylase [Peptoniphilus stercorisuis]MBP2025214.1 5'-methylthioadenosine phosphorylase [Peptoniphilus stercorisuis]
MKKYAIIAGTGFDTFGSEFETKEIITSYGIVNVKLIKKDENMEVYFLPRHGETHNIAPHKINYRANIKALKLLGVTHIYGICAVGSLKKDLSINSIVLINDFLDMTKNRITTFYDENNVKHLDVSNPYSDEMNELFIKNSKKYNINPKTGIYVCTEGPRFESATEIKLYQMLNCDVVGMTNIPEVLLANELNINYSCISYVTNYCTGLVSKISNETFDKNSINKNGIINAILDSFNDEDILNITSNSILL